jgi:hypothetical protein
VPSPRWEWWPSGRATTLERARCSSRLWPSSANWMQGTTSPVRSRRSGSWSSSRATTRRPGPCWRTA